MANEVPAENPDRLRSISRVPIHTREGTVTMSAWRAEVETERGIGAIVLVELVGGATVYRGEGVFLGWSQAALQSGYEAVRPRGEPEPEIPQLG